MKSKVSSKNKSSKKVTNKKESRKLKIKLPEGIIGFERIYNSEETYYKDLYRFDKYCDLSEHISGNEVSDLMEVHYAKAQQRYRYQLDEVNEILKKNCLEPNARFNLGDKGHFSIFFDLVRQKSKAS